VTTEVINAVEYLAQLKGQCHVSEGTPIFEWNPNIIIDDDEDDNDEETEYIGDNIHQRSNIYRYEIEETNDVDHTAQQDDDNDNEVPNNDDIDPPDDDTIDNESGTIDSLDEGTQQIDEALRNYEVETITDNDSEDIAEDCKNL
jgi:hypothetical protein